MHTQYANVRLVHFKIRLYFPVSGQREFKSGKVSGKSSIFPRRKLAGKLFLYGTETIYISRYPPRICAIIKRRRVVNANSLRAMFRSKFGTRARVAVRKLKTINHACVSHRRPMNINENHCVVYRPINPGLKYSVFGGVLSVAAPRGSRDGLVGRERETLLVLSII